MNQSLRKILLICNHSFNRTGDPLFLITSHSVFQNIFPLFGPCWLFHPFQSLNLVMCIFILQKKTQQTTIKNFFHTFIKGHLCFSIFLPQGVGKNTEFIFKTNLREIFLGSTNKSTEGKKHCLLMDEVDGMAGNEDRGGLQELVALIKSSHIPIICMCNDRNHQKMRTLSNYCFDLRFQRPRVEQIKVNVLV